MKMTDLVASGGRCAVTVTDWSQSTLTINVPKGPVLIIKPDGRLEQGEGFALNDETSVQIFDILSIDLDFVPVFR